jgi:hypothetical protein
MKGFSKEKELVGKRSPRRQVGHFRPKREEKKEGIRKGLNFVSEIPYGFNLARPQVQRTFNVSNGKYKARLRVHNKLQDRR